MIKLIAHYMVVAITVACMAYGLISWADVIAHQENGDQHPWNCFVILTEYYYR